MMKEDWARFPRIGTPKQNHVRFFGFTVRTGAAARAEDRRQTGDAGGVSSTVTAIDVVCPHCGANKLLRRIVQLIGRLGAAEHPEVARVAPGNGLLERRSNAVQGLIPGGRTMPTV